MPFNLLDISGQDYNLQMEGEAEVSMLAANDPVFSDLKADDSKAYVRFRICTAFPVVSGPEMHGRFFGFHPQVLVNSYRSLIDQQTNLGHMLKAYGAYRDRIIGHVKGVQVGNIQRQTKQKIAETTELAQYLDVIAVIFKQAEGVKDLLGNHTSAKQKTSVSIEAGTVLKDLAVYDPRDKSIITLQQAQELYPELLSMHKKNGLQIGRVDGTQFAFAAGGEDGTIPFRGVGYTPNPAERHTAKILDLKASEEADDFCFAAMAVFDYEAGQPVRWKPVIYGKDAGRGTIVSVITEGSVTRHGMTLSASESDPLLDIRIPGRAYTVLRHSSSVEKIS